MNHISKGRTPIYIEFLYCAMIHLILLGLHTSAPEFLQRVNISWTWTFGVGKRTNTVSVVNFAKFSVN